jgi:hypothetical protein
LSAPRRAEWTFELDARPGRESSNSLLDTLAQWDQYLRVHTPSCRGAA